MLRSILTDSRHLATVCTALLIGACASTPLTYSNVDASADFSKYRTFGFFQELATDKSDYESNETRYLKQAVSREMQARNMTYSDQPDLKINFYINTEEKIRSRQTPTSGGYYGYRGSHYGAWGGYETRIDQYTEGTLNIDAVDVRSEKLVWEGAIVGRITEDVLSNLGAVLDEAVREIYKDFPVPPTAITPAIAR